MNIDSKIWKVITYISTQVTIIHKPSGNSRIVPRSALPNAAALGAMTEKRFDAIVKTAYEHGR